ncbi:MAG: hypothetical protein ACOX2O_04065 [Bdellovibrionota bacterium]|jgi:hypothetical protein
MKSWSNSEVQQAGVYIPEKRLLAAVLQRAVADYVTGDGDIREGARSWLMENVVTDAPLSFKFICEALDLDIPGLRKAIQAQADVQAHAISTQQTRQALAS